MASSSPPLSPTSETTSSSSSAYLQQSLGEAEVFDLVCDYLRTRQFFEAERTLRNERQRVASPTHATAPAASAASAAQPPRRSNNHRGEEPLASRLEFLLERSYVTQLVSGDGDAGPEKIFVPRHEIESKSPTRPTRTHLDGNEQSLEPDDASREDALSLATRLVTFEACKDDPHGSSTMPIYQTSTFAQPSATNFGAYDYTRSGNPTRAALERQMAELESGHRAFAFTSGMAALSAVTRLAHAGDEIVLSDDSYGGTYRLLSKVAAKNGVVVRYTDFSGELGPKNLAAVVSDKTKLVMMESPTNPMQRICDIRRLAEVAHSVGALLSIDNTIMSPVLQNPLKLGADIVVHSATKFICGHSDTMSGIVIAKDPSCAATFTFTRTPKARGSRRSTAGCCCAVSRP
ncbi:hypothetical protein PINS_up013630 [Pythium insidiosum]|nr:hypothetical protein PINS_up013630 [Pythium insidiosum]